VGSGGLGVGSGSGALDVGSGSRGLVVGSGGLGVGSGSGARSILRASSQKFADDERVQSIWTKSSSAFQRSSDVIGNDAPSGTGQQPSANESYNNNEVNNNDNNNNNHSNTSKSDRNAASCDFIAKRGHSSTPVIFPTGCRFYHTYSDRYGDRNNNDCGNNYSTNNIQTRFSGDEGGIKEVILRQLTEASRYSDIDTTSRNDDVSTFFTNELENNVASKSAFGDIAVQIRRLPSVAAFEGTSQYTRLSLIVVHLVLALGSRRLVDQALHCAAEWLRFNRTSACDLSPLHRSLRCKRHAAYVRAGRVLLNQVPADSDFLATVDCAAHELFCGAVAGVVDATGAVGRQPATDRDEPPTSLIARAENLWQEAMRTGEVLLMKIAIEANLSDGFNTPVYSVFCYCNDYSVY